MISPAPFPMGRPRRLRRDSFTRNLVRENALTAHDLLDDTEQEWAIDAIRITCTPEEPVRVFRLSPVAITTPETPAA